MASEAEFRSLMKRSLFDILDAQFHSTQPGDFRLLISRVKATMPPEDVKLVLKEFEDWQRNKEAAD